MISWLESATKRFSRPAGAPRESSLAPRRLFFTGDSHCLAYDGIRATVGAGIEVACEARFCKSDGGFLASNCALSKDGTIGLNPALAALLPAEPVWLGVSAGGADAIILSMDEVWREYDFFDPEVPQHVDKSLRPLPLAVVREWITVRFEPLREMLRLLRQEGRYEVNLLAPPPPHVSDEACRAYLRRRGIEAFIAPFRVRAKIARLCYRAAREACRQEAATFIDSWRFAADGLALKPRYESDGFHCNRSYAGEVLDLAFSAGETRSPP